MEGQLYYSTSEGRVFWVAGKAPCGTVLENIITRSKNVKKFSKLACVNKYKVRSYIIKRDDLVEGMEVYYTYSKVIPANATVVSTKMVYTLNY